jgi:hypothetical protein
MGDDGGVTTGSYGTLILGAAMLLGPWALGHLLIGGTEITARLCEHKTREAT